MNSQPPWTESYLGGSREVEQARFRIMAREMLDAVESDVRGTGVVHGPRMMYAKTVSGMTNATLVMDRILPATLAVGHFQPGAALPAQVRLSNASGIAQPDSAPDMRGLALRLALPDGGRHDLVLANFPTFLARDAGQFFELFMIARGCAPETLLAKLAERFGVEEGHRIAAYQKASLKLCASLATEQFWSGCPFLWGEMPVRLHLRPLAPLSSSIMAPGRDDALRVELAERLSAADIRWRLAIQLFLDETRTPVEDAAVDWNQRTATAAEIATLVLPRQDTPGPNADTVLQEIDRLDLNPWNAPAQFRPLGSLNRLRRFLYEAGAAARLGKGKP